MNKVAILTDSTANIPSEIISQYNVISVPLEIIWGKEVFEDGVTLQPTEFYQRLVKAKELPTTSQPAVGKFSKILQELVAREFDVLGIFFSSKLSGTYQSAMQAMEMLPEEERKHVSLLDSQTTTLAMGFQILAAARLAETGGSLNECQATATYVRENSGIYFMVDTLEFLQRGGRIGKAQRFLGTALGTKPILYMNNGEITPLDRVRTKQKALDYLVDIVVEKCDAKKQIRLVCAHANSPEDARNVLTKASDILHPVEALSGDLSPVIGSHVGPGTIALGFSTGI